jgi:multidrug resistance efflux pump
VEAVRATRVAVPGLTGQNNRLTLTRLIPNGSHVEVGDLVAEFDPFEQIDALRAARAKADDLDHQVRQKIAQNRTETEKRRSDLRQAEADLGKALLEVGKAEILPEIPKQQNQIRADMARGRVESLRVSHGFKDQIGDAALKILELQLERQRVAMERAQSNIDVMRVKAPITGLISHATMYRSGSMVRPQEGDQMSRGNALVNIFDPAEMLVKCLVGEPDRVLLEPGARAKIYLDAYPDLELSGHFESASPIATSALGTNIKTFTAIFRIDEGDPRLLPDLSAAVVIEAKR